MKLKKNTSLTADADADGNKVLEIRYREAACPLRYTAGVLREGEVRATWTSSPSTTPAYKMPLYTYTGQAAYLDDPLTSGVTEGFGLMFYNARWYDPYLNHFVQADTIIPGGVQGLDRYAAMNNNPVKYSDPSGHSAWDGGESETGSISIALNVAPMQQGLNYENDCGETSFAMAYNYAYGENLGREEVDDYAGSASDANGNPLYTPTTPPYTSPDHLGDIANHYTYGDYQSGNINNTYQGWKLLSDQLSDGNPITVDIVVHPDQPYRKTGEDAHFVVVTGISIDANGNKFVTYNDPFTGGSVTQTWSIFSKAWLHNGDDSGTGNGWWMVVPPLDCDTDHSNPACR